MTESEIFTKLKAINDISVLEHFPKKYLDLTPTPLNRVCESDTDIIFYGKVSNIKIIRKPYSIIHFTINSQGQQFKCDIYHQAFYARTLDNTHKFLIIAKYQSKTKKYVAKNIYREDSPYIKNGYTLKPVYSLPKEISPMVFSGVINRILTQRNDYIHDVLPKELIKRYKLESRFEAFNDIHFPKTQEDLNRGLRVFKYEEALKYCVYINIVKRQKNIIKKYASDTIDVQKVNDFIKALPFNLTKDQIEAVREIVLDMNQETIMYRLLQGDVGTGKTIVAMIALYANYLRGGQGALLAPTQILASQHYESASKLFSKLGINVVLLTNRIKTKERKEIFTKLASGEADIVIGTHTLLSDKLNYKKLSLAIIDEQQNFGVEQRNALVNKNVNTDLLMMTATPIPRTLSKVINADLSVSTLKEFPSSRRSVKTVVLQSMDPYIDKAIKRALEVKRQVFIVAPKIVETETGTKVAVETLFAQMAQQYGEDNVSLLHGKMKEEERNAVYDSFVSGEKLILVATSIVEVGLDVQKACLMVIYSANTFGLSALHQLRGRIGRSGDNALAVLVYDGDDREAKNSLKYLAEHDDGFDIATYDLEHRGTGSLTGINQSGESELQVANFVTDRVIFEYAMKDSLEILTHQEVPEYRLYYSTIYKSFTKFNLD